ncbi:hypothetical protein [Rhodococcoides fascians]|uniref:hypothetical protein n=1 Tax=Rhodococcoides fascians TaxID=1828 RepID=UPI00050CCD86|nr:hypothetical protein [Rhodococcus fascians]
MNKDLRKLLKDLERQGFTWRATKNGHVQVYMGTDRVTTFAGSASDWRSIRNGIAACKRFGYVPPGR